MAGSISQAVTDYITEISYNVVRRREQMCRRAYDLTDPARRDRLEQILDMNAQIGSEDPLAGWSVGCRAFDAPHPLMLRLDPDDEG